MKSLLILFALFAFPLGTYLSDAANNAVHEHRNKELKSLESKHVAQRELRQSQLRELEHIEDVLAQQDGMLLRLTQQLTD